MKLALIGGGGVRAPLFVQAALRRAGRIGLDEICLMDVDARQLELAGTLCQELARREGVATRITTATDAATALGGADYVITTIRPGGTDGRIADERIALDIGVLGQETTGAGGFAMALRSIPAILDYARLMADLCPDAWLINFTNPAGLVTQALRDEGFERVVGICDSANGAQRAVARWAGVPDETVITELFGLNHLSFTRSATVDGRDLLPDALADDDFLDGSVQRVFEHEVVRRHGMWLNEYLYYFYYAEKAVAAASGASRGEEIKAMNARLLPRLEAANDAGAALDLYFDYERERSGSYMRGASQNGAGANGHSADDGEGYAGVALDVIEALSGGKRVRTGLNVPNAGAIEDLRDEDVVEVSCHVDACGIQPVHFGPMPERQSYLVKSVKNYERLTVEAIRRRDRLLAVDALVAHPLVLSYSRARPLVDGYLEAHAAYTGEWA
ncbi:glycosyl hydrolase [Devosia geojensis]|uniref:Glycosyl hydrolase n=1 Tax=Devosia geojensis TaxID=443610 RepID=A0A0F5FT07_9HYPH|nr:glycosyl hydrolase [Devosia geojensis]KKB11695.1 glycosyl hydrolase [Devosia geojensis]